MAKIANFTMGFSALGHHLRLRGCAYLALAWMAYGQAQAQITNYVLGTSSLLVGPSAGTNSVVLGVTPAAGGWTATANTNWLHLDLANQNGTGSTNVIFTYDANPGTARSGTLTIGDQTLTITQAGLTYVAAGVVTALATSGIGFAAGVAVDGTGNVYVCDNLSNALKKWTAANNAVTTLVSSNLSFPGDLVLDGSGNLDILLEPPDNAIKSYSVANSNLTTLVPASESTTGVAVDGAGDIYLSEGYPENEILKWTLSPRRSTILISGLNTPTDLRFDVAGNLYISSQGDNTIKKWTAANGTLSTLVSSELSAPSALAVDGSGNVYIADFAGSGDTAIKMWTAATGNLTALTPGLSYSQGVTVDGAGDVFFSDAASNQPLNELPHVFIDPSPKLEGLAAGSDSLPVVLPTTANLLPPFAPTSDQSWLSITGITNCVVTFSFTANTGPARTAHIALFGQTVPITQGLIGTPPNLTGPQMLGSGVVQFSFTNIPSGSFTVLSSTDLSLPLTNWTVVGAASNTGSGLFQFTSPPTTNDAQQFYVVRSP